MFRREWTAPWTAAGRLFRPPPARSCQPIGFLLAPVTNFITFHPSFVEIWRAGQAPPLRNKEKSRTVLMYSPGRNNEIIPRYHPRCPSSKGPLSSPGNVGRTDGPTPRGVRTIGSEVLRHLVFPGRAFSRWPAFSVGRREGRSSSMPLDIRLIVLSYSHFSPLSIENCPKLP